MIFCGLGGRALLERFMTEQHLNKYIFLGYTRAGDRIMGVIARHLENENIIVIISFFDD